MEDTETYNAMSSLYHGEVAASCEHAALKLEQQRVRCTDFVKRRVIWEQIERHKDSAEYHRRMAAELGATASAASPRSVVGRVAERIAAACDRSAS